MAGAVDDAVGAVGRQCGELVLRGVVGGVGFGPGGEDNQRLVAEVGKHGGLCSGGVGLDELVDPAGGVVGGSGLGANLVTRLRGQIAVAEAADQAHQPDTCSRRAECCNSIGDGVVGAAVVCHCFGRVGLGGRVGGVDQDHARDVVGVAVGVSEDVEAAEGVTGQHVGA